MPIDPNIALSIKPVQIANPLEQYMQAQQIQQAQNQSRLADLMYGEKQQQIARAQGLRDLMKGLPQDATDDQRMNAMRNNAYFDEADKLDTSIQNRMKTKAGAQKDQAEAAKNYLTATQQIAGQVMTLPTQENANAALNSMEALGKQLGFDVSGTIASERQTLAGLRTPEEIKQWAAGHAIQAKELLPKIDTRNLGGTTDTISVDPVTGAVRVVNSAKNTQSPDSAATNATTRRGQDLTDARAREQLEAGRNQIVQSDNGPVLVNTRTGAGKTIMGPDGQPLPGVTKPLNDGQSKALLFGTRMQEADKVLNQLASEGTTSSIPGMRAPVVGGLVNSFASGNQQMLDQAKRDFLNAVLRRESGAAISAGEFENGEKQYFPQIGDSAAVIGQKAKNRALAINGVLVEVPEKQRGSITPSAAAPKKSAATPATNAKGWALHVDANGNKAYVSPDGKSYEEVK